jgi:hypothetical protein
MPQLSDSQLVVLTAAASVPALKKKLALEVTSETDKKRGRVYRITE